MSQHNRGPVRSAATAIRRQSLTSPVQSGPTPDGHTALGAPGYARDLKSELFLLAATNMPGDKAWHEGTDERVTRFRRLVREASAVAPEWTAGLLGWLRGPGGLRLAPVIGAAEFTWARRDEAGTGRDAGVTVFPRSVVNSVLQRPDEPAELAAYWLTRYGHMPIGLQRGLADGMGRLWNEFSLLKYDTAEAGLRWGDLVELVCPRYQLREYGTWRSDLYRHAIGRRHGRDRDIPASLRMIRARRELMRTPIAERREMVRAGRVSEAFRAAGMTHEALAGWIQAPMDAAAWESVIPLMGLDALSRNLRNFDKAGVSNEVAVRVAAKLADAGQVARSRILPYRFLAAYRHVPSDRWKWPLEQALNHSLAKVPQLDGYTLVLVDRSPSMWDSRFSAESDMTWADAAAVFAAAIAQRAAQADLVEFWGQSKAVPLTAGESVLRLVERLSVQPSPGGTDIPSAVRAHLRPGHTRVVIVTDEQTRAGWLPSNMAGWGGLPDTPVDDLIPKQVPVYMWNFGGYTRGALPSGAGNRHTVGGLSDSAFSVITTLEANRDAAWPWEQQPGTLAA